MSQDRSRAHPFLVDMQCQLVKNPDLHGSAQRFSNFRDDETLLSWSSLSPTPVFHRTLGGKSGCLLLPLWLNSHLREPSALLVLPIPGGLDTRFDLLDYKNQLFQNLGAFRHCFSLS